MGKKFGQHFLSDYWVLDHISETVFSLKEKLWCTKLVEIWPGQGVLTRNIISAFDQVKLLEIDTSLEPRLTPLVDEHKDVEIIRWDVLSTDKELLEINPDILVVGNLPYYITSPIFRKFFVERSAIWGVFLIQKEVWEKIKTITKQKSYLWWLLNYDYDIDYVFTVPASAFTPPPKVQSAVVSIKLKAKSWKLKVDFDRMVEFLDIVSQYSRKTLRKIWKMRTEDLASFILPEELEGKRLQELGWEEMERILK